MAYHHCQVRSAMRRKVPYPSPLLIPSPAGPGATSGGGYPIQVTLPSNSIPTPGYIWFTMKRLGRGRYCLVMLMGGSFVTSSQLNYDVYLIFFTRTSTVLRYIKPQFLLYCSRKESDIYLIKIINILRYQSDLD